MGKLKRVGIRLVTEQEILTDKAILTTKDAIKVIQETIQDMDRECFGVLNLKTSGVPINFEIASMGTVSSTLAQPRELLKTSILSNAASVIFFHNHPGGGIQPSKEDFDTTKRLMNTYGLMGFDVLDHVLVINGQKEFYSMAEMGMMDRLKHEISKEFSFDKSIEQERGKVAAEKQVVEPVRKRER